VGKWPASLNAWATLSNPFPYILYLRLYISSIHRYTVREYVGGASFPIPEPCPLRCSHHLAHVIPSDILSLHFPTTYNTFSTSTSTLLTCPVLASLFVSFSAFLLHFCFSCLPNLILSYLFNLDLHSIFISYLVLYLTNQRGSSFCLLT